MATRECYLLASGYADSEPQIPYSPVVSPQREPPPHEQLTPRRSSGLLRGLLILTLIAVLALSAFLGGAFVQAGTDWFEDRTTGSTTRVQSGPTVVVAVRRLANLETASYRMERVITVTEKQRLLRGLLEGKDEILLVASAEVTAGLDLSSVGDSDVDVDLEARSVRLRLQPPKVLTTRLDNLRTHVHSRNTEWLATHSEGLESRARLEAEATLEAAAREAGILTHARNNAETTLRALLGSFGFESVSIDWLD